VESKEAKKVEEAVPVVADDVIKQDSDVQLPPAGQRRILLDFDDATKDVRPVGGATTICLGTAAGDVKALMSSNTFARGSDQNSGNFITDRPSTGMLAPPGGRTTICLGTESHDWIRTSHAFADTGDLTAHGAETARAPPGGKTTIILGLETETFETKASVDHADVVPEDKEVETDIKAVERAAAGQRVVLDGVPTPVRDVFRAPPGGRTTVLLG